MRIYLGCKVTDNYRNQQIIAFSLVIVSSRSTKENRDGSFDGQSKAMPSQRPVPILLGYFISASIQPRSDTNEAFQLMAISLLA